MRGGGCTLRGVGIDGGGITGLVGITGIGTVRGTGGGIIAMCLGTGYRGGTTRRPRIVGVCGGPIGTMGTTGTTGVAAGSIGSTGMVGGTTGFLTGLIGTVAHCGIRRGGLVGVSEAPLLGLARGVVLPVVAGCTASKARAPMHALCEYENKNTGILS